MVLSNFWQPSSRLTFGVFGRDLSRPLPELEGKIWFCGRKNYSKGISRNTLSIFPRKSFANFGRLGLVAPWGLGFWFFSNGGSENLKNYGLLVLDSLTGGKSDQLLGLVWFLYYVFTKLNG
jgi:hypothetical protein